MALFGSVQVGDYVRSKTGIHQVIATEHVASPDQDDMIIYYDNGGFDNEYFIPQDDILLQSEVEVG